MCKKLCVAFSTHSSFSFANNFLTLLDHPLILIRQKYVGKLFKLGKNIHPCFHAVVILEKPSTTPTFTFILVQYYSAFMFFVQVVEYFYCPNRDNHVKQQ